MEKANNFLAAIQTGVGLNYAEIDLPLEEVRRNLLLAQGLVEHDQLKDAGEALERYEQGTGKLRGAEAKIVRQEIQELAETIESHRKKTKYRKRKRANRRLVGLSDRMVELIDYYDMF